LGRLFRMSDDEPAFFHLDVTGPDKSKAATNLSVDELLTKYAIPHRLNASYRVDGYEFNAPYVTRFKVRRTREPLERDKLMNELDLSSFGAAFKSFARVGTLMEQGEDVTDEVLFAADQMIQEQGLSPAASPQLLAAPTTGKVFVVSSFSENLNKSFEAIKRACDSLSFSAVRADKEISSGAIVERVQQHLLDATYVIADLSEARPNVYYEVGFFDAILHARQASTDQHLLLVAKNIQVDAHFDLRHRGIQEYGDAFDLMSIVERWLKERKS
jgi:hypothetical protein